MALALARVAAVTAGRLECATAPQLPLPFHAGHGLVWFGLFLKASGAPEHMPWLLVGLLGGPLLQTGCMTSTPGTVPGGFPVFDPLLSSSRG